jgi:hypothetical protein
MEMFKNAAPAIAKMGVCLGVGAGLANGPSLPDELRMLGVAVFMFAAVYFYYRQAKT